MHKHHSCIPPVTNDAARLKRLVRLGHGVRRRVQLKAHVLTQVCENTLVGNDMIRGVSGGQKKRVTTGKH